VALGEVGDGRDGPRLEALAGGGGVLAEELRDLVGGERAERGGLGGDVERRRGAEPGDGVSLLLGEDVVADGARADQRDAVGEGAQ
jgi:hypothetical protein